MRNFPKFDEWCMKVQAVIDAAPGTMLPLDDSVMVTAKRAWSNQLTPQEFANGRLLIRRKAG